MNARREHLSSADAAWLHMDRPTNLMVINAVLRFDGRLQWSELAEVVRERLVERYPRFSQRVLEGRAPLSGPQWEPDADFDLAMHIRARALPTGPGERRLRELVGSLASIPLDRGRPLWEMHLVDGPGRNSTVIVRMHHCIADGIALARVMLSLTDPAPRSRKDAGRYREQAPPPAAAPAGALAALAAPAAGLLAGAGVAVRTAGGLAVSAARETRETLARPARLRELASALAADGRALSKLALLPPDSDTALRGDLDAERSVAWTRTFPLDEIKGIARAQAATVNDVLLAAVAGALRGYLLSRGQEPREVRAIIPYNLRPLDRPVPRELGNRFGLVFLTLPVDRAERAERLAELKQRMDAIKDSPEGPVSYAVLEAAGLAPAAVESRVIDIFSAKASAVMTNVPGPRETVYLAGVPMRGVLVWAPTGGSVGTSVSIFSYRGGVTVGLLAHTALVPDPQSIVTRLHREVAAMARLAPTA